VDLRIAERRLRACCDGKAGTSQQISEAIPLHPM